MIHVEVYQPPQPHPQPHPQLFTEQDQLVYVHDNIHALQLLTWLVQVDPQATDDVWYAVVDDQEPILPHRGSVQDPVGGGNTIHHVKLYQTYDGVKVPTHATILHVNINHQQVHVEGTVAVWYTVIVCQLYIVVHKYEHDVGGGGAGLQTSHVAIILPSHSHCIGFVDEQ